MLANEAQPHEQPKHPGGKVAAAEQDKQKQLHRRQQYND